MQAHHILVGIVTILVTGAALKAASDGLLGETVQKGAKYVTSGFGSV